MFKGVNEILVRFHPKSSVHILYKNKDWLVNGNLSASKPKEISVSGYHNLIFQTIICTYYCLTDNNPDDGTVKPVYNGHPWELVR